MPRLLLFVPCEKVIIDQENNPTLISILQQWSAHTPSHPPENAVAPHRWDIFTLWHRIPEDSDKEFLQVCELKAPAGQIALTAQIAFRMTAVTHRNIIAVAGLPAHPGDYELALYVSEKGAEKERELRAVFPLIVRPFTAS